MLAFVGISTMDNNESSHLNKENVRRIEDSMTLSFEMMTVLHLDCHLSVVRRKIDHAMQSSGTKYKNNIIGRKEIH